MVGLFAFSKESTGLAGMRYPKPGGQQTTKTLISSCGEVVETWEDNAGLIQEEAFPKPLEGVRWNVPEKGGEIWKRITDESIREALFDQSVLKAPGPDKWGFIVIRMFCERHSLRIIAWTIVAVTLGIRPLVWKVARAVVIPKPNKPDYPVAKAYRVIMLLNCLGKVVEMVTANAIAEEC